jgi:hypothetical protein
MRRATHLITALAGLEIPSPPLRSTLTLTLSTLLELSLVYSSEWDLDVRDLVP